MPHPPLPPRWLLRRADQTAVAVLVVAAIGGAGRLVDGSRRMAWRADRG